MFSWLKFEILELPRIEYLVILGLLIAVFGFLVYYSFSIMKRYRFMDGTATSRIRSAPQGHVELKGLGEWMPNGEIHSPFSKRRCLWYHCSIDKKHRSGKRLTWTNISDERSSHMFRLVDDTGDCIVDPDHAHVIPEMDTTWYGHSTEYSARAPKKPSRFNLSMGSYRFRERLLLPASNLYALGWFRTVHSNPSDEFIARQVEELVRTWKLQPARYLREYDLDQNGKIEKREWKVIRAAARKQVLNELNKEKKEHHVISSPTNSRQPYILSAKTEEDMVTHKKWKARFSIAGALLTFTAAVTMISIRTPFSI
ncbi:MAG: E3 ubiquitin ligase family protein [Gammaproteobacteria bacterium]|nr:E3 ubiquitin ligase family protein [Gammaproteobacteria bacterium]